MRVPLLVLALLFTAPAFAQVVLLSVPAPRLVSPSTPNPDFPLRVSLRVHGNTWDYTYEYYAGHGKFQIASSDPATPARTFNFEYQCGFTFLKPALNQFQARWIKPDKTLQILLYDPGRPEKPRTCNLTASTKPFPHIPRWVAEPVAW